MKSHATITVERLAELSRQGSIDLIDVRTPIEFREVHATIARNVPLDELDPHTVNKQRTGKPNTPLYLICKAGSRGAKACQKFTNATYSDVVNVEGGTDAWVEAGLPVVRGKKIISLERQVRITAGLIVLASGIMAIAVHPYFAGIAVLIGGGLVFAGITDTCGMGMMLAKMPWNRTNANAHSCSVE